MELELTTRRQVTRAMLARYAKGSRREKGEVLDQLVGVTGWHRDHARRALRRAAAGPAAPGRPREPVVRYRSEVIDALAFCWAVLDGPTGKRLAPALPALVPALRHHDELAVSDEFAEALLSMSAATIDRRLAGHRQKVQIGKGRAMTRPGSLLKSSLPLKTWAEWTDQEPGFTEIDLVSHDGGDNNGHYCWSLCVTDVATGWTQARTVMGKGERGVAAALGQIQLELPFHLAGIHSDNGSEFINHHLAKWVDARQITFTRSRPANKNDNAYVEQKNWSVIRRAAGYFRYDTTRELDLLNQLWHLECQVSNVFCHSRNWSARPEPVPRSRRSTTPLRPRPDVCSRTIPATSTTRTEPRSPTRSASSTPPSCGARSLPPRTSSSTSPDSEDPSRPSPTPKPSTPPGARPTGRQPTSGHPEMSQRPPYAGTLT